MPTLRKGYVRQFIDRVEVSDREIRIVGPQAVLADGVLAAGPSTSAGVPRFGREWRRRQSAANPSPFKFPATQGINREFSLEAGLLAPSPPHKELQSL